MSCCGSKPEPCGEPDTELRGMIDRLRERRKALRGGDGFSHAGTLIGAYKRSLAQLEALLVLVETLPPEAPAEAETRLNPDCIGTGGDNVPGCDCRKVFDTLDSKNK